MLDSRCYLSVYLKLNFNLVKEKKKKNTCKWHIKQYAEIVVATNDNYEGYGRGPHNHATASLSFCMFLTYRTHLSTLD